MRKPIILALLLLLTVNLYSQRTLWTLGTARTVPAGQQEFGILHPLQIGVARTVEIQTQPLMTLALAPNITVKKRWYTDRFLIASKHTYAMPTMLLRTLRETKFSMEGEELIADTLTIPYIFTLRNEGIVSRRIGPEMMISGNIGFQFNIRSRHDSIPNLMLSPIYMHSTTLNKRMLWFLGAKLDGNIIRDFNFMVDLDFISSGLGVKDWSLEHRGYFIWNKSVQFAALVGYKMGYGSFPDPLNRFYILPMVDLIWKINLQPQEPEKDLFRR